MGQWAGYAPVFDSSAFGKETTAKGLTRSRFRYIGRALQINVSTGITRKVVCCLPQKTIRPEKEYTLNVNLNNKVKAK